LKGIFLSDDEIIQAAKFAFSQNYASIVLQSGELKTKDFIAPRCRTNPFVWQQP